MLDDERGQKFAVLAVGGAALLLLGVSVRDGRPRRGRAPSGSLWVAAASQRARGDRGSAGPRR